MHFLRAVMQRGALLVFYFRGFAAVDSPHIKRQGVLPAISFLQQRFAETL
jgi:hypothetical protein